ncbi:MAG: hypothetical protein ACRDRG_19350 [Pseudonocardiaceae bacterium]
MDDGSALGIGFGLAQDLTGDRCHLAIPEEQIPEQVLDRVALSPVEVDMWWRSGDFLDV